jgi:hypothetical protein
MQVNSINGQNVSINVQASMRPQNAANSSVSSNANSAMPFDTVTLSSSALALQREHAILANQNGGLTPSAGQLQTEQKVAAENASQNQSAGSGASLWKATLQLTYA